MTQTGPQPVALPNDPVRTALDDSVLRDRLLNHALALLGKRFRHGPETDWREAAMVAFQDTCVRALEKRHNYNATLPIAPWLHGVMNLVLCETIRSREKLPVQELSDTAAWEALAIDLTPDVAETVPNQLAVAHYLGRLRADERQIVELRYLQDLTHDEIAAVLGITPGAARVRLSRALVALKAVAGRAVREDQP
jgi:RNA polymerase sigma factor (sigma-70 family)